MARVLVNEADCDVRRLLVVMVERLGHESIVLDADAAAPPRSDLMLLDSESPSCVEAARAARESDATLPIICLGAVPEHADFLRRGPLAFLQKPFTLETLRGMLDGVLVGSPV